MAEYRRRNKRGWSGTVFHRKPMAALGRRHQKLRSAGGQRDQSGAFMRAPDSGAIFRHINTDRLEFAPALTADELTLYFTRVDREALEEGVAAGFGLYVATRPSKTAPFSPPERIEAISGYVEAPTVTPDGCGLYFHKRINGVFTLQYARRSVCLAE